jgi:hypothetical protein
MNRPRIALVTGILVVAFGARAYGQACDGRTEQRLDQENYLALTDRVYVYAPDISSAGGGWQSFNLRILSGMYRKPMLLAKAYMRR